MIRVQLDLWAHEGFSPTVTMLALLMAAPSQPPRELKASKVTPSEITLEWKPPPEDAQNGIITQYLLIYECTPRGHWQEAECTTKQAVIPATSMNHKVKDLTPFTEYSFEIAAETHPGRGPFSPPLRQNTSENAPSAPPGNITVQDVTDRSISLTWDTPPPQNQNGHITGYIVCYAEIIDEMHLIQHLSSRESVSASRDDRAVVSSDVCSAIKSIITQNSEVEIDSLRPSTMYSVSVAAETKAGLGPMSDGLAVSTLESVIYLTIDVNFSAVISTDNSSDNCFNITFSWDPPFAVPTMSHLLLNNVTVTGMNCSIYYKSVSPVHQNGTINDVPECQLPTVGNFLPSVLYSFWMGVDFGLSNGTYGHLRSLVTNLLTPICSELNLTVDVRFTAEVILGDSFIDCFAVVFHWDLNTSHLLLDISVIDFSLHISSVIYENGTVSLATDATNYNSSNGELLPSTYYSFLLTFDVLFSNGTYGHLQSSTVDLHTPSCSGGNHTSNQAGSQVWKIAAAVSCVLLFFLGMCALTICCLARWLWKRQGVRQTSISLDSFVSPALQENEYVSMEPRVVDGAASSELETEESTSPSPVSVSHDSDTDSEVVSFGSSVDESSPFLGDHVESGLHRPSRLHARDNRYAENLSAEDQSLMEFPSDPRQNPDGCSITSSSDSSLLEDV